MSNYPEKQGLYDPRFEHDACGVGFVVNIKGVRSNEVVRQSLEVLKRLAHRGAVGSDPDTGDGAGVLMQMPDEFCREVSAETGIELPPVGEYASGLIFFPQDDDERRICREAFEEVIDQEGQNLLGWRTVPVDNSIIGKTAKETEPIIEQIFIGKNKGIKEQLVFERKLYVIRKQVEKRVRESQIQQISFFYITNLSSFTLSFKGLLMPHQVEKYFSDLKNDNLKTALCLVHSRYSTNTFPTWDLAQPFRFLAHNGEINTLRGNINWMHARESLLKSDLFGDDIEKIKPVIVAGGSDSATLDNVLELIVLAGRSLPSAMRMLIPEAWENNQLLDRKWADFCRYNACLMEPWDGPAAVAFTDGVRVGAILDRNGLRPARYIVTKGDSVVMASEVGVLDIDPADILVSGRLEPGKMFFVDTEEGRIVHDDEIKESMASKNPCSAWLADNLIHLDSIPAPTTKNGSLEDILVRLKAFGYTREDLRTTITPMALNGREPIGSMGDDTPLAIFSMQPQLLYKYFKQHFAQVTNPAIDPIRENCVMSLSSYIGSQKNILEDIPEHCRKLHVGSPILSNEDFEKLSIIEGKGFKTKTISTLFKVGTEDDFLAALNSICIEAENAIQDNFDFIILSDRGISNTQAALPALLALGVVHHYLVKKALRTQIGIIVESGEPREVHHFALLLGYGADCINPYLAYQAIGYLVREGNVDIDENSALENYKRAAEKGIRKILSKMGISTLQSYRGAQIFEALGLGQEVIDKCFIGTISRIGGLGFAGLAEETISRHKQAFPERNLPAAPSLATGGHYQWRRDGEFHLWNPETISAIQDAVKSNNYERYREFSELINNQRENPATLRGLLRFKERSPISIEEVEPVEDIFKRFVSSAMSFGSISKQAHEAIAVGMNRIHAQSNTGEGGEDPMRFIPLSVNRSRRSAVKQVASGRFGVTTNYLVNADEIQIKIAQGAKPGEGGQLPGHKVSRLIASTRYTTPGVTLISPPPHHDIYSIEDLAQLIFDLKNTNPSARISVKLVSEMGVGTIAAGVAKGHADMILISGGDGGTGASPMSSIKNAGLPWELGLSETHQTLILNDLRSRVRLQTDGQMRTGRDVVIAAILGAEEYGFGSAALVVIGCVMLRHCHLNNCTVGVATQDDILQHRFNRRPKYLVNYFRFVAQELREIMAQLGVRRLDDLIGRTDLLEVNQESVPSKARDIDYSRILYRPEVEPTVATRRVRNQNHGIDNVLDRKIIRLAREAVEMAEPIRLDMEITSENRTTGAMLSGEVARTYMDEGLPEDTVYIKFTGIAGQSFGAWLTQGITFELEGLANDYVGKGISGGKIIIYPHLETDYQPEGNIIIGNTSFYGAILGEAYIRGVAGERFCIRNSGLYAVVEGVGDHGCEYMTGGVVVVLGNTGRNFAAGMSGGLAYVYDRSGRFQDKCNMSMVELEELEIADRTTLHYLLVNHRKYTRSTQAKEILDDFKENSKRFIKVIPIEYKHILGGKAVGERLELRAT